METKTTQPHSFLFISFIIAALALLCVRFWLFFDRAPPRVAKQASYIGIIDDDPEGYDLAQVFPVTLVAPVDRDGIQLTQIVRVRVYVPRYPQYAYGDELELTGNLSPPRNFKSDNGLSFDYRHYLEKDDIYYEVKNPKVRVISHGNGGAASVGDKIVSALLAIKHGFLAHVKSVLGEPQASLAGGLVVGEKSALGKDLIDDFRRAGLIHIVVLSGYNITIVATAIRRMFSFLPRMLGIVLGGIAMILFCVLVGGGATVVRSCIMGMIALGGEISGRAYSVGRALAIAAYLMVWHNPRILLYDPSFQLSFLATLALVLLAGPIERWFAKWPKYIRLPERFGLRGLVSSTIATQIFVSPFIFYLMGQISVIGVLVNILVLPIIPATMFVVTAIGLGGYISIWIAKLFALPAYMLLSYELGVVKISAHLPGAVFTTTSFSFTTMVVVYILYALAIWLWLPRGKEKAGTPAATFATPPP